MEQDGLKNLLEKNLQVAEESLGILKKMQRARRISGFFKIIKWLAIIFISLGLYYYIEPYLRGLIDALNSINSGLTEIKKADSLMEQLREILGR